MNPDSWQRTRRQTPPNIAPVATNAVHLGVVVLIPSARQATSSRLSAPRRRPSQTAGAGSFTPLVSIARKDQ